MTFAVAADAMFPVRRGHYEGDRMLRSQDHADPNRQKNQGHRLRRSAALSAPYQAKSDDNCLRSGEPSANNGEVSHLRCDRMSDSSNLPSPNDLFVTVLVRCIVRTRANSSVEPRLGLNQSAPCSLSARVIYPDNWRNRIFSCNVRMLLMGWPNEVRGRVS